jgi:hypothetical protein
LEHPKPLSRRLLQHNPPRAVGREHFLRWNSLTGS